LYRIFIVVSIMLLSGVVVLAYSVKPKFANKGINILENEDANTAFENDKKKDINVFNGDEPLRVLVLGVDKTATKDMTEEQNGMRTDTMMVFTIDPKNDKVQILSIPRDSYIKIHGYSKNKINAAFNEFVYPDGGLGLTVKTIEDFLDVKIDHYAVVDYKAVVGIVDTVGGIDIEWNQADYTYRDDWVVPPLEINLKRGTNHLDGESAVAYLRTRKAYADQDLGRISAQQDFLMKMFDKLKTPATIFRLPKILDLIDRYVETDLNYGEISYLAHYGLTLDRENIFTATIEGTDGSTVIGKDKVSIYNVSVEEARKLMNDFLENNVENVEEPLLEENILVE